MVKVTSFEHFLFLFTHKLLWKSTILFRIANRENPDETAFLKHSDLGLPCLAKCSKFYNFYHIIFQEIDVFSLLTIFYMKDALWRCTLTFFIACS